MYFSKSGTLLFVSVLGAASLVSCATAPPGELVEAREQYRITSSGPAAKHAPAALDTAKKALNVAEAAFEKEPKAAQTRDLAYVAQRKAQLADAKAAVEIAAQKKLAAGSALSKATKDKLASNKAELAELKQENQDTRVDLAASEQKTANSQDQLAESKAQLETAKREHELREAQNKELIANLTANLTNLATIKEDARGTVISLSGGVLFVSGKATLLPGAMTALDSVAGALTKRNNQAITIEGHTDSVGSAALNDKLSRDRAEAVRTYLVSRGVEQSRVTAVGFGSARPVADNATADGRANNRRVEIVLQKST